MHGKHMGHTSTGKHRVLGKPQGVAARAAGQAGGLAGGCTEHVSHGSRVGMEGIHRAETSMRRLRAEICVCCAQVPWPCDAAQPGRDVHVAHVAHVARAPIPSQCSHVPTRKVAPTASTPALGPCAPSVPRCSREDKARQHRKSAMSAQPLQRNARPWNPRSWQHLPKV